MQLTYIIRLYEYRSIFHEIENSDTKKNLEFFFSLLLSVFFCFWFLFMTNIFYIFGGEPRL